MMPQDESSNIRKFEQANQMAGQLLSDYDASPKPDQRNWGGGAHTYEKKLAGRQKNI